MRATLTIIICTRLHNTHKKFSIRSLARSIDPFVSRLVSRIRFSISNMSGCGNTGCPCGSTCQCGSSCSCGSKRTMDIENGSGMESFECDKDGCQCGSSCTCSDCKC